MARRTFVTEKILKLEEKVNILQTDLSFIQLCLLDLDKKKLNRNEYESLVIMGIMNRNKTTIKKAIAEIFHNNVEDILTKEEKK